MTEALVEIDPVIYGQVEQNIYGTLDTAIVYYQIFSKYVVDVLKFELNPYDACVANKVINRKVCMILWWVNDIKLSHEDVGGVNKILNKINQMVFYHLLMYIVGFQK